MRLFYRVGLAVLLGVTIFFAWKKLNPSEVDRIHSQVAKLERLVQWSSGDHILQRASNARALDEIFHENVEVEFEAAAGQFVLQGVERLREGFVQAQHRLPKLSLDIQDLSTEISDDALSAKSQFTAVLRGRTAASAETFVEASEFESEWEQIEGDWKITRIKNVEALQFQ